MKRTISFLLLTVMLVVPASVFSCGPFFEHVVYAYRLHPDLPLRAYAAGDLGIVRPSYARSYLYVAYTYLEGKRFAPAAQQDLVTFWEYRFTFWPGKQGTFADHTGEQAVAEYLKLRQTFAGAKAGEQIEVDRPIAAYTYMQNCNPDAFRVAATTLRDREQAWGAGSADLREWLAGQDLVFAACSGKVPAMPESLPAGATSLLRADRDYQIAAANFYLGNFDLAEQQFGRMASASGSPWSARAPYLRVRALIRKATLGKDSEEQANLAAAEKEIDTLLADRSRKDLHSSLLRLRAFVEFRLHPEQRAAELARRLADPADPSLVQDLWDFLALTDSAVGEEDAPGDDQSRMKVFAASAAFRARSALADWILTFQSPAPVAADHAYARWHETKSAAWLVAALSAAAPGSTHADELVRAAAALPADSPAFVMAGYHAARLLGTSDPEAARAQLAQLPEKDLPASAANQVQTQRALAAASLADFLRNAVSQPVALVSDDTGEELNIEWGNGEVTKLGPRPKDVGMLREVAAAFNTRLPLAVWSAAADDAQLPAATRADIALAGWARALVLGQTDTALAFAKTYAAVRPVGEKLLHDFLVAPPEDRERAGLFVLSNLPGARPFLTVDPRKPAAEKIDDYRDNWWCPDVGADLDAPNYAKQDWREKAITPQDVRPQVGPPAFLSAEQRSAGAAEWKQLGGAGAGPRFFANAVLAWAAAAPSDPRLPEAMYRAVRVSRYGCGDKAADKLTAQVFQLMRQRYPTSPWTARARRFR